MTNPPTLQQTPFPPPIDSDKAGTSAPATSNTTDNTKAESPDIAVIVIIAVAAAAVIAVAAVLIAKKKKK